MNWGGDISIFQSHIGREERILLLFLCRSWIQKRMESISSMNVFLINQKQKLILYEKAHQ